MIASILYSLYDQHRMSKNLTVIFYLLFYIRMEKFKVWNVAGLTKFSKGEIVLTDCNQDANWEVRVYKTDCDWDFLLNDNGNKVSYSLAFNRLRPLDVDSQLFTAGTLEQRVMKKTFTDEKLDKAADYIKAVNDFSDLTMKLRNKLGTIANNLMWKINELTISADAYDAEAFSKALSDMEKVTKFLKGKPMTDIKEMYDKLIGDDPEETFDPQTLLD